MPTKTKIKWRLGTLPTPDEAALLVREDILTKEEAREILISQETEETREVTSLQAEIKFLRELVEKLSNNRKTEIVRQIEYIEKPYIKQPWFQPYVMYASTNGSNVYAVNGTSATLQASASNNLLGTSGLGAVSTSAPSSFSGIKTF